MRIVFGLSLGILLAVLDAFLLHFVTKKAASQTPEQMKHLIIRGFAARYLLTFAGLMCALLIPIFDALYVVLPMIAQKGILVIFSIYSANKK